VVCLPDCGLIPDVDAPFKAVTPPTYSNAPDPDQIFGTRAYYLCTTGYYLNPPANNYIECLDPTATWSAFGFTCDCKYVLYARGRQLECLKVLLLFCFRQIYIYISNLRASLPCVLADKNGFRNYKICYTNLLHQIFSIKSS
jgi:hypothetical protein